MNRDIKVMLGIILATLATIGIVSCIFGYKTSDNLTPPATPVVSLTERLSSIKDLRFSLPEIKQPTYLDICEGDFIDAPVRRSVEESIEEIKNLTHTYPDLSVVIENVDRYPKELLKSLAANPEMVHFSIHYLTSDGSISGGLTDSETPDSHPLFLQWDPRWGYMKYGSQGILGSSGCGPAALSMAVYYLTGDTQCTPDAVAKYSLEKNYYIDTVGTTWALLDKYPTEYGLKVSHPGLKEQKLKAELDKGNILIVSCRPGDFTYEGHFIVIYDYDEEGFKINDPKCIYRSHQTWTYAQIKDDIKRIWSIGK